MGGGGNESLDATTRRIFYTICKCADNTPAVAAVATAAAAMGFDSITRGRSSIRFGTVYNACGTRCSAIIELYAYVRPSVCVCVRMTNIVYRVISQNTTPGDTHGRGK